MGVAAHQPAVFSQWLNRSEVLVGTVKAGKMAWRNSFKADAGETRRPIANYQGCGAGCSPLAGERYAWGRLTRF